jgi:hypothetical protein
MDDITICAFNGYKDIRSFRAENHFVIFLSIIDQMKLWNVCCLSDWALSCRYVIGETGSGKILKRMILEEEKIVFKEKRFPKHGSMEWNGMKTQLNEAYLRYK